MKNILCAICTICCLAACSEDTAVFMDGQHGLTIDIAAEYPVVTQTRATENGFTNGDQVGIFIVDYDGDAPGTMALSGNRASNVMLTYDETAGKWSAPMTLYWATDGTPADIIGYYPFNENLESTMDQPFTIQRNQNTMATETAKGGYEQSDLLWAKAVKVSPTSKTITLKYQHIMAGIQVRLERGDGFTDEEWSQMRKTVLVSNTQLSGTVNLSTGAVSLSSTNIAPVTALTYGDAWRAVVLPQTVTANKALVCITIDGQTYELTKTESMTYLAGKMHNFTIKVNRRTAGGDFEFHVLDEAVIPWEVDAALYDGLTRAYTVVYVNTPGTLKDIILETGADYKSIYSLKVVGSINQSDLSFMGKEMEQLSNINLYQAQVIDSILTGFYKKSLLTHFVFPAYGIKEISDTAFYKTGLTGNLILPEGIITIGAYAFARCNFYGNLSLPTTLKEINTGAFSYNKFEGELRLPEGIERIKHKDFEDDIYIPGEDGGGIPAFYDCIFSGELHLPDNLRELTYLGFPKMRGDIIIPQGITELKSPTRNQAHNWGIFSDGGYDGIVKLPEGLTKIGSETFARTKIRGEVALPSTLRMMDYKAFEGTRISKIIFNDGLASMEGHCFRGCSFLSGTIVWPKSNTRVPEGTFEDCSMLSGIVLHKDVKVIADDAFLRCNNLISIVCESEEPPLVGEDAFLGVSKWNAVVEVPASAVEKYKNAEGWSDFLRIVAHNDFDCQPQKVCALNKEHEESLVVYSDGPWTVEYLPDWCTLSKTSGTGKTAIELTVNNLAHGQDSRSDSIVFKQTNGGYTTCCKVAQYDYEQEEDSYITMQQHSKGNGVDIVFVGDGWDAPAIADGSYLDLIQYQAECFFAIEPYRSMRDYFNVYVTIPLSQEKGVNTMYTYVNNKFGTLNGVSSISGEDTSSQLITEPDEIMNYVQNIVYNSGIYKPRLVILVPNTTDYSGNTILMNDGNALSICPPSEKAYPNDTRGTIQHEAGGHGFGKLGDEMITFNGFANERIKQQIQEMHWRGWYQNLSTTGKLNEVPWADFIFDPRYSDRVDVYEGGYGYTRGIYRPEANSCMNYGIPYYNTPSRLAIWKRIKEYAGEPWTMEEFYAQDTFEWGPTIITMDGSRLTRGCQSLAADRSTVSGQGYAEASRHVAPQMVDFKKMGREVRALRARLKQNRTNRGNK